MITALIIYLTLSEYISADTPATIKATERQTRAQFLNDNIAMIMVLIISPRIINNIG